MLNQFLKIIGEIAVDFHRFPAYRVLKVKGFAVERLAAEKLLTGLPEELRADYALLLNAASRKEEYLLADYGAVGGQRHGQHMQEREQAESSPD